VRADRGRVAHRAFKVGAGIRDPDDALELASGGAPVPGLPRGLRGSCPLALRLTAFVGHQGHRLPDHPRCRLA
jgi:hypothetical protein